MKYLFNKLKLVGTGVMALSFLLAVSLSSCGGTSNYSDDDADADEATEQVEGTAESAEEHPAGEEEEHQSDSTAAEHPEGDGS